MANRKQRDAQGPPPPATKLEVRVNGRLMFSRDVYEVDLDSEDSSRFILRAHLEPTLPYPARKAGRPHTRATMASDPREGEEVLTTVHSGSRE